MGGGGGEEEKEDQEYLRLSFLPNILAPSHCQRQRILSVMTLYKYNQF